MAPLSEDITAVQSILVVKFHSNPLNCQLTKARQSMRQSKDDVLTALFVQSIASGPGYNEVTSRLGDWELLRPIVTAVTNVSK